MLYKTRVGAVGGLAAANSCWRNIRQRLEMDRKACHRTSRSAHAPIRARSTRTFRAVMAVCLSEGERNLLNKPAKTSKQQNDPTSLEAAERTAEGFIVLQQLKHKVNMRGTHGGGRSDVSSHCCASLKQDRSEGDNVTTHNISQGQIEEQNRPL